MTPGNPLIAHRNRADAATLSGGAWQPEMDLELLQDPRPGRKARSLSADPAETRFLADLGPNPDGLDMAVRVAALAGHSLSVDAALRLRGWEGEGGPDGTSPLLYDSWVGRAAQTPDVDGQDGPELLPAPGFSTWDDGAPAGWQVRGGDGSSFVEPHAEGLRLVAAAGSGLELVTGLVLAVRPGRRYRVSLELAGQTSGGLRVAVRHGESLEALPAWELPGSATAGPAGGGFSVAFTARAALAEVVILPDAVGPSEWVLARAGLKAVYEPDDLLLGVGQMADAGLWTPSGGAILSSVAGGVTGRALEVRAEAQPPQPPQPPQTGAGAVCDLAVTPGRLHRVCYALRRADVTGAAGSFRVGSPAAPGSLFDTGPVDVAEWVTGEVLVRPLESTLRLEGLCLGDSGEAVLCDEVRVWELPEAAQAWPSLYSREQVGEAVWAAHLGRPTREDLAVLPRMHVQVLPEPVAARTWLWEIMDPDNPDGCVELGRLWLGPAWQFSAHLQEGYQFGWQDETPLERTRGGTLVAGSTTRLRTCVFTLELPEDEAVQRGWELQGAVGVSGQVLAVPRPWDAASLARESMLARLSELSALEFPLPRACQAAFQLEEVL